MLGRTSSTKCTACLSAYRHRNLHSDSAQQRLSPFEMESLPRLWRSALAKNPSFCEHVVHSWMTRCIRRKTLLKPQRTLADDAQPESHLVVQEGERLLFFLTNIVEGIEKKEQVTDRRGDFVAYAAAQEWIGGRGPRWWRRRKESIAALMLLSEALIDQFIAQLDMEDVHERELLLLVWKHFIVAVISQLEESVRKSSRSCLSLSLSPSLESHGSMSSFDSQPVSS